MRALIFGLSLLWSCSAQAQAAGRPQGSHGLGFAESLFAEQDYYRAITEYKRFLFERPRSALEPWVRLRIGECYLEGGRYSAAVEVFDGMLAGNSPVHVQGAAMLAGARAMYLDKRYQQAEDRLDDLRMSLAGQRMAGMGDYLRACVHLRSGRPEMARIALAEVSLADAMGPKALSLLGDLGGADRLPRKIPWLAGLLSLVPGLGHIYLEQVSIGLTAFVWNGVFGFATYEAFRREQYGVGALLACLELLWYSGTIYGAVTGAERYNADAWKNYLDELDGRQGLDISHPGARNLGLMLEGRY